MRYGLYFFIGAFVLGVLSRSFVDLGMAFALFLISLALFIGVLMRKRALVLALIFLGIGLGILRFDSVDRDRGDPFLDERIGTHIGAEGIIIDEPDEREDNAKLIVLIDTLVISEKKQQEIKEKIIVTADIHPRRSYGDRIFLEGELRKPEGFTGDDGKYFDYEAYLGKSDIFYQIFYPNIKLLSVGNGNFVKRNLFALKGAFLSRIGEVVPDPQASLLGGLVVGAKRSLGEELQNDFRETGIIHIVVLSGYNVTIVAEAISDSLAFLPRYFGMSLGALSIILFAVMTGASATIVRASIMALLVIAAKAFGRTYIITHALMLAGFLMILHNPKILVFDSSFQLSFAATVGLIYIAPHLEKYFTAVPAKWKLREFATATVSTQLFVLPMILYKMGELSIVALPVNLLILIFVPATMLFGFLTGVIGFVSTTLSLPFAYISHALLSYELFVVDIFAKLSFASLHINYFPLWLAVLVYALYGLFLLKLHKS